MAKLTEESQRAMFARTLRAFDRALCEVGALVAHPPCSAAVTAAALAQFEAARAWLREFVEQSVRVARAMNDPSLAFLESYVVPALDQVECRLAARRGDTAEAIAASIVDARVKLTWCLTQLA